MDVLKAHYFQRLAQNLSVCFGRKDGKISGIKMIDIGDGSDLIVLVLRASIKTSGI